jgi:hypothetical protein
MSVYGHGEDALRAIENGLSRNQDARLSYKLLLLVRHVIRGKFFAELVFLASGCACITSFGLIN